MIKVFAYVDRIIQRSTSMQTLQHAYYSYKEHLSAFDILFLKVLYC